MKKTLTVLFVLLVGLSAVFADAIPLKVLILPKFENGGDVRRLPWRGTVLL